MTDTLVSLLLFLGCDNHLHTFAFEFGHLFRLAIFEQRFGKFQQLGLALLFVEDGTSAEEDLHLHFVALLQETDGMIQFELKVMIVGLGTQSNLLDDNLGGVGFLLLLAFLLLIEIFLILYNLAHRRIGIGADLDQIQPLVVSHREGFTQGIDVVVGIVAHHAHHRCCYLIVDTMFRLLLDGATSTPSGLGQRFNVSDNFFLLYKFILNKHSFVQLSVG